MVRPKRLRGLDYDVLNQNTAKLFTCTKKGRPEVANLLRRSIHPSKISRNCVAAATPFPRLTGNALPAKHYFSINLFSMEQTPVLLNFGWPPYLARAPNGDDFSVSLCYHRLRSSLRIIG